MNKKLLYASLAVSTAVALAIVSIVLRGVWESSVAITSIDFMLLYWHLYAVLFIGAPLAIWLMFKAREEQ